MDKTTRITAAEHTSANKERNRVMVQKIIDILEKECEKNPDNMTNRVICNHVVELLEGQPEDVLKSIIDKNLSIDGAIAEMRKAAEKVKTGNCGVLTDSEGFAIVDKYFGLDKSAVEPQKTLSLFDMI